MINFPLTKKIIGAPPTAPPPHFFFWPVPIYIFRLLLVLFLRYWKLNSFFNFGFYFLFFWLLKFHFRFLIFVSSILISLCICLYCRACVSVVDSSKRLSADCWCASALVHRATRQLHSALTQDLRPSLWVLNTSHNVHTRGTTQTHTHIKLHTYT